MCRPLILTMLWYIISGVAIGFIVVFAVAFTAVLAKVTDNVIFGSRQDKNPQYKYFKPEDFNLTVEHMPVRLRGVELAANLYTVKPAEECERVVIFQHGFGAGSSSYMTEIAHFARQGFAVVAADAYGCNDSEGEQIKGFYAGAEAVIAAYIAVNCDERLKDKKIILVGHSWGAYSVLAAGGSVKADGVVALSGFNAPAQCVCDQLKNLMKSAKFFAPFLHGWFWLYNFFKFGAKGNLKAAKAVKKSGAKTLIIHGGKDRTVGLNHSAANKVKGDNVTTLVLPDKKHNPYNTVAAEEKLAELGKDNFASGEEEKAYFASFDWAAATEEDEEVMRTIDEFILKA